MQNISFRYFYDLFQEEFCKRINILKENRIGEEDELDSCFPYFTNIVSNEERLSIYDEILYEVCASYITLSGFDLTIYPKTSFEFVSLLLNEIPVNPYYNSFLLSFQFIIQDYLECLGRGRPVLFSSQEEGVLPNLQITFDRRNQLTQFDAINLDLLEEDKILLKVLTLEKNNQIGPIQNVSYRYRKDI